MATYYISVTGNGVGTINDPISLSGFLSAAVAGDVGLMRAGTYRQSIVLPRSGAVGNPITLSAYNNETVVVSGCDVVGAGSFTHQGSNVYTSQLSASWNMGAGANQVFLGDVPLIDARWPYINSYSKYLTREDFAHSTAGTLNTTPDTDGLYFATYSHPDLANFSAGYWTGGKIALVPGKEWNGYEGDITSHTGDTITFKFAYPATSHAPDAAIPRSNNPFYLYNKDYNGGANTFFFSASHELKLYLSSALAVDAQVRVRDILLDGNNFSYWNILGIKFFAGRIFLRNSCNTINFDNIAIEYSSWALSPSPAMSFRGSNSSLTNSSVLYAAGNGIDLRGSNHSVDNCVVGHSNVKVRGSHGVIQYDNINSTVSNCTIYATTAYGAEGRLIAGELKNCHIAYSGLSKSDVALVTTWDSGDLQGCRIHHNLLHDCLAIYLPSEGKNGGMGIRYDSGGGLSGAGGVRNGICDHNIVYNLTSNESAINVWGLTVDQIGGSNPDIKAYNNTCYGGIKLVGGSTSNRQFQGINIRNNFCWSIKDGDGNYNIPSGVTFENNITVLSSHFNNYQVDEPGMNLVNATTSLTVGKNQGQIISPYTDGYLETSPDIGAMELPFDVGAKLQEFEGLTFEQDPESPTKIKVISPISGRGLPTNYVLRIGSHTVSSHFELLSPDGIVTSIFSFTTDSNIYQIQHGVNTGSLINSGVFVALSSFPEIINYNAGILSVSGKNLISPSFAQVPVNLSMKDWLLLLENRRVFLLKIPFSLVEDYIGNNRNFRIVSCEDEYLTYWIDCIVNGFIFVWVNIGNSIFLKQQTTEDIYPFYVVSGNSAWDSDNSNRGGIFSQLNLSSLQFWFQPQTLSQANNSTISSISNTGINQGSWTSTSTQQPTFLANELNNLPAIRFDGVNDILTYQGTTIASAPATILIFYRNPNPSTSNFQRYTASNSVGSTDVLSGIYAVLPPGNPGATEYVNGNATFTIYSTSKSYNNFKIGGRSDLSSGYMKADVSEILVFNTELVPADRNRLRDEYLAVKYNLSPVYPSAASVANDALYPVKIAVDGVWFPVAQLGQSWIASGLSLADGSHDLSVEYPDGSIVDYNDFFTTGAGDMRGAYLNAKGTTLSSFTIGGTNALVVAGNKVEVKNFSGSNYAEIVASLPENYILIGDASHKSIAVSLASVAVTPTTSLTSGDISGNFTDGLTVENNAITDAKIGNRTIDDAIATAYTNSGVLGTILSWFAKRLKEIIGGANWSSSVPTTLTATSTHISSTANPHATTAAQLADFDDKLASTLVQGSNVTLTHNDIAGTVTIDATGGSGGSSVGDATPIDIASTAVVGVSTLASRQDHTHTIGSQAVTNAHVNNSAAIAWAKLDKTGAVPGDVGAPVLGTATPADVGTASAGTATAASKEDHSHALGSGVILDSHVNASAAIGWAKVDKTGAVPSDVGAPALGTATPSSVGTASAGTATVASKEDHSHAIGSGVVTDANVSNSAAIGWSKISKAGAVPGDIGAQPLDSDLSAIAALTPSNNTFLGYRSDAHGYISAATARDILGLSISPSITQINLYEDFYVGNSLGSNNLRNTTSNGGVSVASSETGRPGISEVFLTSGQTTGGSFIGTFNSSGLLNFGDGDFLFETSIYPVHTLSSGDDFEIVIGFTNAGIGTISMGAYFIVNNTLGTWRAYTNVSSSLDTTGTGQTYSQAWTKLGIVRTGTTIDFYFNGSLIVSKIATLTGAASAGVRINRLSGSQYRAFRIDYLRIQQNIAAGR